MKNKQPILIAMLLFLYGVVTYGLFLNKYEPSPSILIREHPNSFKRNTPLLKGIKTTFEIVSPYDGLGIIALRFQTNGRVNDDVLTFRIKPKNSPSWTYVSNYKTDQFQDHELFPFGFPIIPSSAGKTYQIELESATGTEISHVSIDAPNPIVVSKYHHPVNSKQPITLANFLWGINKVTNLLTNSSSVFPILVFFSPLMVFLINSPTSLAVILTLLSAQYILNLPTPYHWVLSILLAWLTFLLTTKAPYRVSVALSLLAALNLLIRTFENNPIGVDQAAIWLYYCLLLTIIQIKLRFSD